MKNLKQLDEAVMALSLHRVDISDFAIGYSDSDFVDNKKTILNKLNNKHVKIGTLSYSELSKKDRYLVLKAKIGEIL